MDLNVNSRVTKVNTNCREHSPKNWWLSVHNWERYPKRKVWTTKTSLGEGLPLRGSADFQPQKLRIYVTCLWEHSVHIWWKSVRNSYLIQFTKNGRNLRKNYYFCCFAGKLRIFLTKEGYRVPLIFWCSSRNIFFSARKQTFQNSKKNSQTHVQSYTVGYPSQSVKSSEDVKQICAVM